MGREVTFSFPPKRVLSLVPSQTEFLLDIGAPVVGRTKFCVHPKKSVIDIPIIGGTKKFRFDRVRELKPDLIIGNKEENYKEGIEALEADFPVWISDIYSLEDAFQMMSSLGRLCDLEDASRQIILDCRKSTENIKNTKKGTVLYLIWKNPWMAAGSYTFIDHLLTHLGYQNIIQKNRYPTFEDHDIDLLDPDHIFLSSEPYPFKKDHLSQVKSKWPNAHCQLVDGEIYSWYGSRLRYWKKKHNVL